jgi:hypothetical protein
MPARSAPRFASGGLDLYKILRLLTLGPMRLRRRRGVAGRKALVSGFVDVPVFVRRILR